MSNYVKLSKEEAYELIAKAQQGDQDSMELLYESYKRFIHQIVNKMNPGKFYDDFFQYGCMGFVKAVKDFNLSLGYSFTTFMEPKVRGEILRYIRDFGGKNFAALKFQRNIKILGNKVKKLSEQSGMSFQEVTAMLGLDPETERDVIAYLTPVGSLQETVYADYKGGDDITLEESIPISLDNAEMSLTYLDIQKLLDEREKLVFHLKFEKDLSQAQIAKMFGLSQVQISRIEAKIKSKIIRYLGYDPRHTRPVRALKQKEEEDEELRNIRTRRAYYIWKTYPQLKQADIARILKISEATVSSYVKQFKKGVDDIEPDPSIEPQVQEYLKQRFPEWVSSPVKVMRIEDLPEEEREKYMVKEEQKQECFEDLEALKQPLAELPKIEPPICKSVNSTAFTFAGNGEAVKALSSLYLGQIMSLVKPEDNVEIKIEINVQPKAVLE